MNNTMNRKFTTREIVLLIILVVMLFVGLYFLLIYYPLTNKIAQLNEEKLNLQSRNDVADVQLQLYNQMKAEIEEINKIPEEERTEMHKYTPEEGQAILDDLQTIFAGTNPTINYRSIVTNSEGIVQRTLDFSFAIDTSEGPETAYNQFKDIIYKLTHTQRRCLLGDLTISPTNGSVFEDGLRISGSITFYETTA